MAATLEIEQAAALAAKRVRVMLVEMLTRGETGEVVVTIDHGGLEPVKRVATKSKRIGVARGHGVALETVG